MSTWRNPPYPTLLPETPGPPCLSLYQPTERHYPDTQQNVIRFRNLVKVLERSLREKYGASEIQVLLEPFHRLADDPELWTHMRDGLAVLGARSLFRVYRLQRTVPELAIVADSFHTKPLLRIQQSADRFHVLGLGLRRIRLFEGNRDALDEVELAPNVPSTITEALGEEQVTDPHVFVAVSAGAPGGGAVYQGRGSKTDETRSQAERFFRAVDRAILEHYSQPSGLPLILAALPEHHAAFRRISRNPSLIDAGIDVNPEALTLDGLRARAWRVLEPSYLGRLAAHIEEFGAARAKGLGSDDLAQVAEAAVANRVGTLLIEAERERPGRIDHATGRVEVSELARPDVDDALDDLAEMVLHAGGHVVVVPASRMPTTTGLAAIYRF